MSPRSGTPVKLLGREDASVDWYNLEKSKRVKAFRCGEFDACIEKAEASQGIPIKKREKYARREDAILHALELEKQSLERQQLPLGSSSSNERSGFLQKEFNTRSSFGRQLNIQKVNHAKMLKCEDDIAEATHRMRGLRDFGLRTAPPKRKFDVAGASESSQSSLLFDSQMLALPDPWQCVEEMNYVPGTKSSLSFKEKKSEGSLLDDSLGKRCDRRHPLVQVLQSSANVSMPKSFSPSNYETDLLGGQDEKYFSGAIRNSKKCKYHYPPANSSEFWDHTSYDSDQMQMPPIQFDYPGSLVEEYTSSGFIEMDESDSSERDYLNPDLEEAEMLLPGNQPVFSRSSDLGRYEEDCSQPFYLKENYGSPNYGEMQSGHISALHPGDQIKGTSTDTGISKWHVKGKRNIRLTKRMMEAVNGSSMNGFMNGVRYDRKTGATNISREGPLRCGSYSKFDGFDENEHTEKDEDYLLVRNGNSRYSSMLKGTSKFYRDDDASDSDEDAIGISPYDWEADGAHASQRMYQEEPRGRFHSTYSSRHGDGLEPMLIDVDLKVQASYQGERVPLVSLMSKLNGKAIIGHPVQIEKLDDGSTDALLYRDGPGQIHAAADENLEPHFHQTSKGAAFQHFRHSVPISPALDWKQPVNSLDLESKSVYRKPYPVQLNHQPKSMKMSKSVYRKPFPVQLNHQPKSMKMRSHDRKRTQRKHKKRSSKKATSSNQKTRTLSSFAAEQKLGIQNRKHCSVLDGLIKPGDTVPIVTCVPVKVVFSRLLEAVGRPPAPTHRTILRGSVNEKPL